jgi:hypothetical protein
MATTVAAAATFGATFWAGLNAEQAAAVAGLATAAATATVAFLERR